MMQQTPNLLLLPDQYKKFEFYTTSSKLQLYRILCTVVISFFWSFYAVSGQSTAAATVVHRSACNVAAFTLEFLVITYKITLFKAFCIIFFSELNKSKCY